MGSGNILEQFRRANQPAWAKLDDDLVTGIILQIGHTNSPSSGIKVLARRSNSERQFLDFRRQGCQSGEGNIVKAIVDLIRKDNNLVLDTEVTNLLQLILGEDLADRVICRSQ